MTENGRPSRIFSKLFQLDFREWTDLLRAMLALGKSRLQLSYIKAPKLQTSQTTQDKISHGISANPQVADWIARVKWAIPRAARYVPWRSDCLVQAQAGQNWLKQQGIQSEVQLGARKLPDGRMDAHAWLICEGEIVTGGDITSFAPFR